VIKNVSDTYDAILYVDNCLTLDLALSSAVDAVFELSPGWGDDGQTNAAEMPVPAADANNAGIYHFETTRPTTVRVRFKQRVGGAGNTTVNVVAG
jgi:hypothetical protein